MKTINPKTIRSLVVVLLLAALASSPSTAQSPLDDYIQEGLKSNLVLKQKEISMEQAQQSFQIARSYFLPSVQLLADYTSGEGGRSISIPVGDLLNPVYASLNQMTQSDAFPQIENVNQNFFPKNFYDAKIRTSIPLINTDLYVNRSIQGQQVVLKQLEREAYKRQLVLDIKTAYYNLLSADAAVKIYESALTLVNKNVEINESLLKNGKSLPANVLRSKSEAQKVKADLNNARNNVTNARKYFNFLLNRELDTEVDLNDPIRETISIPGDTATAFANTREELQMIKTVKSINESSLRMTRLNKAPKVNAFLDLGTQAYDWKFNNDSRYYLVGVQLTLPLFQGFRNSITSRQGSLEIQKTQQNLTNTARQLDLAVSVAKNNLQTTTDNYTAAQDQLRSAQSYFNLVEKGYREGVNSLIEYLDARNQLTSSQLQLNLRQFEMLIAEANLERETASYTFQN
jgi:outer membrane protein